MILRLFKVKLLFLFLFLIITLIGGCASPPAPSPSPQPPSNETELDIGEYLPLKKGNKWVYEGVGNEYASFTQEVVYAKNNSYQVMINNGGTVMANRYVVTEDRILHDYREGEFYEEGSILDKAPNLNATLLKLPLEVGSSWDSEGHTCEIFSVNSTVQVPAGTFSDCIVVKISYPDSGNTTYQYFKKHIGMVKSEYIMEDNEKVESLLKEYTLR